jgi:hypothetical protein
MSESRMQFRHNFLVFILFLLCMFSSQSVPIGKMAENKTVVGSYGETAAGLWIPEEADDGFTGRGLREVSVEPANSSRTSSTQMGDME